MSYTVTSAFKEILGQGRIPVKLQTDEGGEFYNKGFQRLMTQYKIHHFSTSNETKASVVSVSIDLLRLVCGNI